MWWLKRIVERIRSSKLIERIRVDVTTRARVAVRFRGLQKTDTCPVHAAERSRLYRYPDIISVISRLKQWKQPCSNPANVPKRKKTTAKYNGIAKSDITADHSRKYFKPARRVNAISRVFLPHKSCRGFATSSELSYSSCLSTSVPPAAPSLSR